MTPAEYLEHVQEALSFPPDGVGRDPKWLLYATDKQCELLRQAHAGYCLLVAVILDLQLPQGWEESGGPEDRPTLHGGTNTRLRLVPDSDGGTPD